METKGNIKFFQVLVTNWHRNSLDVLYTNVFNYATLEEAMKCPFYADEKNGHVANGEPYIDHFTGKETYQYVLQYIDSQDKKATLELRHERIIRVEDGQTTEIKQTLIKEVIL